MTTGARPDLRRSVHLYRNFRQEQSDPDAFYGELASDSVEQLTRYAGQLDGRSVLDVGGGPGYFADAFRAAGARYVAVDADAHELAARGGPGPGVVLGSGLALPVRSASVDVCYSSNVLEHVAEPWRMADEMLRVTAPGGTVFLSYTTWLGPWGGHETSPWHYLGGARARSRYRRRHGHEPKNRYGESLFAVSVRGGIAWSRQRQRSGHARTIAVLPRYHPWWSHWVTRVPGLREVTTWNLVLVLRRTGVPLQRTGKPSR